MHKYLYFIICLFIGLNLHSQNQKDGKISILTMASGDEVYSTFGHTAIRIKQSNPEKDIIYNFGTYDFNQPNFYPNFLRGKLLYSLTRQSYPRILQSYHYEKRSIYDQSLNLTPEQEAKLIHALAKNYQPDNRQYLYEFFFDNCSTRPRDLIYQTIDSLTFEGEPIKQTFRNLLNQYSVGMPWAQFGMSLIVGNRADRIATRDEQMFIPLLLHDYLNNARLPNGEKLVSNDYTTLDFTDANTKRLTPKPNYPLWIAIILVLIEIGLLLAYAKRMSPRFVNIYDKFWYLVMGIGGLVVLFMWFATDHYSTKSNWNVLWLTPLYFIPLFGKWLKPITYILTVCFALLLIVGLLGIQWIHWAVYLLALVGILKLWRSAIVSYN